MKILLVDDDHDDRSLYQEIIQEINPSITCEVAGDGVEAIAKLSSAPVKPDLILLDINMPRMDGRDCLKIIRETTKFSDVPVLVVSTSISKKDQVFFASYGAPWMEKPNEYEELVRQLKNVIESFKKMLRNG
jgi:DNA-binding response OmpR family regulator